MIRLDPESTSEVLEVAFIASTPMHGTAEQAAASFHHFPEL